ncbi:MAG: PilT/PilU family type 4a pilus ATPase [bacterium]|nr:PilT/PilU family type 4a pilus ATPase [bacterium]
MYSLKKLLALMNDKEINASDLHIKSNNKPYYRINKNLVPVGEKILTENEIIEMIKEIINEEYLKELNKKGSIDYGYYLEGTRYRINIFKTQGSIALAARRILNPPDSFEILNLPSDLIKNIVNKMRGLVLVSGPAGSGKTTTCASIIQYINKNYSKRIVSIEDPIEYVFNDVKSFITQREVGLDTTSFLQGLKDALRQDPDIIFIGELRDPESTLIALNSAETGHMVITTVHSENTIKTIYRILDMFKEEQREVAREILMNSITAIISQKLVNSIRTGNLLPVIEILVATPTIRGLIRDNELNKIYDYILNGEYDGMITFGKSLKNLIKQGHIAKEMALKLTDHPEELYQVEETYSTDTFVKGLSSDYSSSFSYSSIENSKTNEINEEDQESFYKSSEGSIFF